MWRLVALVQFPERSREHTVLGHRVDESRGRQHTGQGHGGHGDDATKEASNTTVVPATESAKTVMGFSTAWLSTMNQSGAITATMMYATTA